MIYFIINKQTYRLLISLLHRYPMPLLFLRSLLAITQQRN